MSIETREPLRIVVVGAHPDDPESGCGGLIAKLTGAGHEVVCAYATACARGRMCGGRPEREVREAEARAACELLRAKAMFFPYEHETFAVTPVILETFSQWLRDTAPHIVVAHWPIDTHLNHHAAGSIVWQCYLQRPAWQLYFFEVMNERQTMAFMPGQYLDIGDVCELKRRAVLCHESQNPEEIWRAHERMHGQRGEECGVQSAEGYCMPCPRRGLEVLPVPMLFGKKRGGRGQEHHA